MVGHYCAVPHCHNQVSRDPVRFFKIIRKNEKQTNLWIKAINRLESDGITPWTPKAKSAICSAHFEGDSFSKDPNHIDYVPTLFLTKSSTETTYIQKYRNVKKSNSIHGPNFAVVLDRFSLPTLLSKGRSELNLMSHNFRPRLRGL